MDTKIVNYIDKLIYEEAMNIANDNLSWEKLKDKTIMITGANGFIAYYLILAIIIRNDEYNNNIKILGLVRNRGKAEMKYGKLLEREDFSLIIQDICEDIKTDIKSDFIIHGASQASAIQFENDPLGTLNANLLGTINTLDYAKRCNSESTLFISSLKVYGTLYSNKESISEDELGYINHLSYKNCYAQGKRGGEALCACYNKQFNIPIKIARPSYIYGPSSLDDDRVWAQFIANVVQNENILLKSNGAANRSYCYVTDTAIALLKILLEGEDIKPYNISSNHSNITIRNFAKLATEIFSEKQLKLSFENKEDEEEPTKSPLDSTPEILDSKRLNELGWTAKITLKEGIKKSVEILKLRYKD